MNQFYTQTAHQFSDDRSGCRTLTVHNPTTTSISPQHKGSRKKVLFLVAGPLRGGGGAKRVCHQGKKTFFNVRKKVPIATKPREGGAKGLSGRVKKRTFFAASLICLRNYDWSLEGGLKNSTPFDANALQGFDIWYHVKCLFCIFDHIKFCSRGGMGPFIPLSFQNLIPLKCAGCLEGWRGRSSIESASSVPGSRSESSGSISSAALGLSSTLILETGSAIEQALIGLSF